MRAFMMAAIGLVMGQVAFGQTTKPAAKPADVPVKVVVLFSSGVGYFEHIGNVKGDSSTELRFKTAQINDILKSLVLQDMGQGKVSAVTYPSQDPIGKTLASFQVNLSSNPSLADLLNQLRGARVQDKKTVTINFQGQGERMVRVGYVVETPIWKTSYRLLFGQANTKPALQGWAIVENQTDNDWTDVELSLVSGRPISFIQELYQPLYIPRPIVYPELFASLRPQTYEAGMKLAKREAMADLSSVNGGVAGEKQAAGRRLRAGLAAPAAAGGGF